MLPLLRPRSSYRRLLTIRPQLQPHSAPRAQSASHSLSLCKPISTPIASSTAGTRAVHTGPLPQSAPKVSNEPKVDLGKFFGPSLPGRVYSFWFQHVANDQNLTLPTPEVYKPWFTQDAVFDLECATQFKPILAALHQSHQSHPEPQSPSETQPPPPSQVTSQASAILSLVNPTTPQDWLGLILLLDQLPRNCYRGTEAALVYTFFDPIARAIASAALEEGVPSAPEIRYRLALRHWFYLPFMHSEDLSHQELVLKSYREMDADIRQLLDEQPAKGLGKSELTCREILASNREAVEANLSLNFKFQEEHHDIIARFGRYPYRNAVLGRTTTPDEEKFLKEANISFA
ncbi:DUF924 family protein [Aspergillus mulundensis]|uniref:DUF924-domain-containing protein n=1 Tax=Aspergillus mulundensis TaxID=1810919 RepID=A0A3D8T6U5_9EURO|nr:Uncharacterized protein DSM5745_01483 [Aspergillus mulundensis]RDW94161.1 Uncharacterized protein DSM5745_01483 [Aspergillus mulundensis]